MKDLSVKGNFTSVKLFNRHFCPNIVIISSHTVGVTLQLLILSVLKWRRWNSLDKILTVSWPISCWPVVNSLNYFWWKAPASRIAVLLSSIPQLCRHNDCKRFVSFAMMLEKA